MQINWVRYRNWVKGLWECKVQPLVLLQYKVNMESRVHMMVAILENYRLRMENSDRVSYWGTKKSNYLKKQSRWKISSYSHIRQSLNLHREPRLSADKLSRNSKISKLRTPDSNMASSTETKRLKVLNKTVRMLVHVKLQDLHWENQRHNAIKELQLLKLTVLRSSSTWLNVKGKPWRINKNYIKRSRD